MAELLVSKGYVLSTYWVFFSFPAAAVTSRERNLSVLLPGQGPPR